MLRKIFLKMLWDRRKDCLLVVLSGIFVVFIVFFSAAVGNCLNFVKTGEPVTMTPLIQSVEDTYLMPYLLLLFLLLLILIFYIQKRSKDYAMLTVLGLQKKHRCLFIGMEYLGIILSSVGGRAFGWFCRGINHQESLEEHFCGCFRTDFDGLVAA